MRALKNYFSLSDYAPAYRRQGFQKTIPHLPAGRQGFFYVVKAFLIGVIIP